jgi:hypothetical protein
MKEAWGMRGELARRKLCKNGKKPIDVDPELNESVQPAAKNHGISDGEVA